MAKGQVFSWQAHRFRVAYFDGSIIVVPAFHQEAKHTSCESTATSQMHAVSVTGFLFSAESLSYRLLASAATTSVSARDAKQEKHLMILSK